MIQALIDTDILIDSCFNQQPFAEDSIQILQLCELKIIQGFITPLSIINFYYLIRKANTHHQTMAIVKKMNQLLSTIPVTAEAVTQAIESAFKDFEDAIQYHT
ncbi:MAG: type II toxin-antitoxin system VapC family toxin, partial [Bacteroidota bacterium]